MAFPKKGANPFKGKRAGGKAPKALPKGTLGEIPPPALNPLGTPPGPLPPAPGAPPAAPGGPAQSMKAAMLAKMLAGGQGGGY